MTSRDKDDWQKDLEILKEVRKRHFMEEEVDDQDTTTYWFWLQNYTPDAA